MTELRRRRRPKPQWSRMGDQGSHGSCRGCLQVVLPRCCWRIECVACVQCVLLVYSCARLSIIERLPLFRARFLETKRPRDGQQRGLATTSGAMCALPHVGQLTACNHLS
jgi:hypothetical protein